MTVRTVGIPKEIKPLEKRVGLAPEGVRKLSAAGIRVLVEAAAGAGSGFSDEDYRTAGAAIVSSPAEVYNAGLIQKIKEPLPAEFEFLKPNQVIFSFLHLASPAACGLVKALRERRVTAIAYETLEKNGQLPLLGPMSEIAGSLSALFAAILCAAPPYASGAPFSGGALQALFEAAAADYPRLPTHLRGVSAVIFGGGVAGMKAAETLLELGGSVRLVEMNPVRRGWLNAHFAARGNAFVCVDPADLRGADLEPAQVLIGAVHQRGKRAALVLSQDQLKAASHTVKKVIMDISIDQGGNFPGSRPTSYCDPVYRDEDGNVRFCVPNIPALAGRFATLALNELSVPYTLALAQDLEKALRQYAELAGAVNVLQGEILLAAIREVHRL